ncbi:COMM domain-containing protein 9 isoform X1 [Dunckerocampus dactyliophorus]|uniref:COMM domain-containing protein 9 isoform X1 n=1 Tax=Dunckerocampus dactyliophorus TaxID=161453 RepID=UPI002406ACBC|nr:COMM domain-containing protein 9 isoform X1 [Dunckerocampus dactyliophorus]
MAAKLTSEHFDNLQLLLKAPSKDAVKDVCMASYRGLNRQLTQSTAATLSIPEAQAAQLVQSLHVLSQHVVFHNLSSPEQILHLFPEAFHSSLRNLLTKILLENSAAWKTEAVSNQISLPQLKELDWRVDMVTSSDSVSRMCVPTCLVQFKTEDLCPSGGRQSVAVETVELSRETVDTMLDGLGRIRDQLSVVAGK